MLTRKWLGLAFLGEEICQFYLETSGIYRISQNNSFSNKAWIQGKILPLEVVNSNRR